MTWYWLPLLLILIPIAFAVAPRYRGRRRKVVPQKVFQESMTRRHTPKRIADTRVELADWEVNFTTLELELALEGFAPLQGTYVSSKVLKWCYENDRDRFDIFMAHNNRIDIKNLGYSGARMKKDLTFGGYDAKRHSNYY